MTRKLSATAVVALAIAAVGPAAAEAERVSYVQLPKGQNASEITLGSDGNIWYVGAQSPFSYRLVPLVFGRVTPGGKVKQFRTDLRVTRGVLAPLPQGGFAVGWTRWKKRQGTNTYVASGGMGRLTVGGQFTAIPGFGNRREDLLPMPDAGTWFTESQKISIVREGAGGVESNSAEVPGAQWMETFELETDADGNVWFVGTADHFAVIGRVSQAEDGSVVAEIVHKGKDHQLYAGLTRGPGRSLWFYRTEPRGGTSLVTIDPDTRAIRSVRSRVDPNYLRSLVYGPDGNFWFGSGNGVARISPGGKLKRFKLGRTAQPEEIAFGSDRRLWFTQPATPSKSSHRIGRFKIPG